MSTKKPKGRRKDNRPRNEQLRSGKKKAKSPAKELEAAHLRVAQTSEPKVAPKKDVYPADRSQSGIPLGRGSLMASDAAVEPSSRLEIIAALIEALATYRDCGRSTPVSFPVTPPSNERLQAGAVLLEELKKYRRHRGLLHG